MNTIVLDLHSKYLKDDLVREGKLTCLDGTIIQSIFDNISTFCKNKGDLQDELVEESKLAGLEGTIIQSIFDNIFTFV